MRYAMLGVPCLAIVAAITWLWPPNPTPAPEQILTPQLDPQQHQAIENNPPSQASFCCTFVATSASGERLQPEIRCDGVTGAMPPGGVAGACFPDALSNHTCALSLAGYASYRWTGGCGQNTAESVRMVRIEAPIQTPPATNRCREKRDGFDIAFPQAFDRHCGDTVVEASRQEECLRRLAAVQELCR